MTTRHLAGILIAACFLALAILTDGTELSRRTRQAVHAIASAVRRFAFGDHPGTAAAQIAATPGHPAVRAARCQCKGCAGEMSPVDFGLWEREVRQGRGFPMPRRDS